MLPDVCPKTGAVFQYFCSQNPSKVSKISKQMAVKACDFCKKKNRKGGMATLPKPSKKKLRRSHFEEFASINSGH